MSTESLKLQLIERLLRTTDEGLLKKVADLFRSEKDVEGEDGLTDEHYNIVKEREATYKRGEGKSYTWDEAKDLIRSGKGKDAWAPPLSGAAKPSAMFKRLMTGTRRAPMVPEKNYLPRSMSS